ncbi:MAG: hypothetical protein JJLCMIEE_01281 [Acidimicrobiales bacterium]|nr:MAG: hypothetical protein EDR02_07020 [Actinomycetota bacterium]MBV6508221.1 hypothetical protein [Acidimicrobiales bacterium]RIK07294.1 MAG: hypothetical protein DCC48_04230 [Acidobacteriota bacterium]
MLSSIHPLGERAKGNRYGVTLAAYMLGSLAGGLVLGAALGLAGSVLRELIDPAFAAMTFGAVCMVAFVADRGRWLSRLPSWHRQVNEDWLAEFRGWVYGSGFGFQLGLGVVTIIPSAIFYAVMAAGLLVGSVQGAVVIGGAFGLVRGLVLITGRRIVDTQSLLAYHRSFQRRARLADTATSTALLVGAGTLLLSTVMA